MSLTFPPSLPYQAATFLERGTSVPFTTPMLAGTRVRHANGTGLEFTVPNPSGGKGQYVLTWASVQDLCHPTLHDRSLQQAVATLSCITPATVRTATRGVASKGLAGRPAKLAAQEATARDVEALVVTNYHLLVALVREVTPSAADYGHLLNRSAETTERIAKNAVATAAASLGCEAAWVAAALEDLANILVAVGIGSEGSASAHLPRTIARLEALQSDMQTWLSHCSDDSQEATELVRAAAGLTLTCATTTLADARQLATRPFELLEPWRIQSERVAAKINRTEWILDGWETICAVWEAAQRKVARSTAIAEIAHFAPALPREAGAWLGNSDLEAEAASLFRRSVEVNQDWRSGSNPVKEIARREHLLAMNDRACSPS